jgi:hypothetical protein
LNLKKYALWLAATFSYQSFASEINLGNDVIATHPNSQSIPFLKSQKTVFSSELKLAKPAGKYIDLMVWFQPNYVEILGIESAISRMDRWVGKINESLFEATSEYTVRLVNAETSLVLSNDLLPWSDFLDSDSNPVSGAGSIFQNALFNSYDNKYEYRMVQIYQPDLVMLVRDHRDSDELGSTVGLGAYLGELSIIFDLVAEGGAWVDLYDLVAAHEIGHNLGAHHETANVIDGNYQPEARAYTCVFNTVMWSSISVDNHQFFSDPFKTYEGEICGDVDVANNAKVVRENAAIASTRREPLPSRGEVSFSQLTYSFGEVDVSGYLQLVRTGDLTASAQVDIIFESDTATSGVDMLEDKVRVIFNEGQSEAYALIHVENDGLVEGQEFINARLRFPVGLTIENDTARIRIDDGSTGSNGEFLVSVTGAVYEGDPVTVQVVRFNGSIGENFIIIDAVSGGASPSATINKDFAGGTWQLSFLDGETTKSLQIQTFDDVIFEQNESFDIIASNYLGVPITNAISSVVIVNNDNDYTDGNPDNRGEFIVETSNSNTYEDAGPIEIKVYRINGSDTFENIILKVTGDGLVVGHVEKTILFTPGQSEIIYSIPVIDNEVYSGESFVTSISIKSNDAAKILTSSASVTVFDNEIKPPGFVDSPGAGGESPTSGDGDEVPSETQSGGPMGVLIIFLIILKLSRRNKVNI